MEAKVGSRRAAGGARAGVSRHGMGGNHAVILPSGITSSGKSHLGEPDGCGIR